ncbi:accessory Sec system glycosyltransferase GtfA [Streptococcus sp. DD12]|uniref:accessory Sec system glycosyltransferase GtfA n=1 Tax=Streptococcus sp. DD12 TaxID=1777880 RepID=UPI0007924C5E|nr:accessory Sec system glycosyltransferase GtfA [Streptococcus sp. DD12]KXT76153.1 Poly(glycerol-phosphate) alpha-glucosyltransferase GftA [Streptococcus sp. DD12]
MTVYNINLGIGWASSGVEYAQAYRATAFRNKGIPAKFVFMDMFQQDNLCDLTRNIGFADEEIIWLYGAFTDVKIAPTSMRLADFEAEIPFPITRREPQGRVVKLYCEAEDLFYTCYLSDEEKQLMHRVEMVSRGNLIRKDFFSYTRIFTEYYTPRDNRAYLYQRRFYNEDGSVAYDEIIDNDHSLFKMKDRLLPSKEAFIAYFMESLSLTAHDLVILDRSTGTGQAVFSHVKPAKLAVVVHAEHFSENAVTDDTILWNNFYEYQFTHADKVDAFICATQAQADLLGQQFAQYTAHRPTIVTIPVGSIDSLKEPQGDRKPYAMITASRLAGEKHVDWLTKAVVLAHQSNPAISFDIYGSGGEEAKIRKIIEEQGAQDYIRLMGHHDLTDVYKQYALYLSASKSEGFGLTLLEAVGSGLPLIGFDVRYGNQTFISDGENGYLIPRFETDDEGPIVQALAQKILQLFAREDQASLYQKSYQLAQDYLTSVVEEKWATFIKELTA